MLQKVLRSDKFMTINNIQQNQIDNLNTLVEISNAPSPESVESVEMVETIIQDPKQNIMNHLKHSSDNFLYFSVEDKERTSKIREHIQQSLSWATA